MTNRITRGFHRLGIGAAIAAEARREGVIRLAGLYGAGPWPKQCGPYVDKNLEQLAANIYDVAATEPDLTTRERGGLHQLGDELTELIRQVRGLRAVNLEYHNKEWLRKIDQEK